MVDGIPCLIKPAGDFLLSEQPVQCVTFFFQETDRNPELRLNPILTNSNPGFHLIFHLQTGSTSGFNPEARDRDVPFTAKDEPATLPRVQELVVICESSPWCTIVRNERGVTLQDVCTTIWKEYTDNFVTDAEFASLPPRLQDALRRTATNNQNTSAGWNVYYTPAQVPNRYKRVDWLRDKVYFDGLLRNDHYTINRLGYKAPNIFVMQVAS